MSLRIAVFASGGGTNLQALLDHFGASADARVVLVVSDNADAGALVRARAAGVDGVHVPVRGHTADDVAAATLAVLHAHDVQLVCLAGYLRLVPPAVVQQYSNRMLNIHPALLPAFGGPGMYGRRVHDAVLAAGCVVTGATVHWVTEQYDEGRIVAQWPVPVLPGDTSDTLAARVLRIEHVLYPAAVAAVARAWRDGHADHAMPGTEFKLDATTELNAQIMSIAQPVTGAR